jgi:histidinol-phosphate aminotransferase
VARLEPYAVPSAGRRGFLRLDFNESAAGPSPRVLERLRRLEAEDVALYPDETAAREAVRLRFSLAEGLDLVLTSGVDEGIRLVCDCFLRPGETAVLLEPGYAMYRFYAALAGARLREVTYAADLSFPAAGLREALRGGARLVLIGNPNNPTGTPAPDGLVEDLAASHPRTVVLADEAYVEFGGRSALPSVARLPNLIVARTFSKAYGLAGLRAGVLLGRRETLAWIGRMRSPYAVNAAALAALPAALGDQEHVERYVAEVGAAAARLREGLAALGVAVLPSAANFLIARFGGRAAAVRAALRDRGVLVRDRGEHPLLRGTLRIGIGTRRDADDCLAALRAVLAETGEGKR